MKPLRNQVLVSFIDENGEAKSPGGIIMPGGAKVQRARVVEKGEEVRSVTWHDVVILRKGNTALQVGGNDLSLHLLQETDILAIESSAAEERVAALEKHVDDLTQLDLDREIILHDREYLLKEVALYDSDANANGVVIPFTLMERIRDHLSPKEPNPVPTVDPTLPPGPLADIKDTEPPPSDQESPES